MNEPTTTNRASRSRHFRDANAVVGSDVVVCGVLSAAMAPPKSFLFLQINGHFTGPKLLDYFPPGSRLALIIVSCNHASRGVEGLRDGLERRGVVQPLTNRQREKRMAEAKPSRSRLQAGHFSVIEPEAVFRIQPLCNQLCSQ
jgi:hypothetical protein